MVPPRSDRVSRAPPYSRMRTRLTHTGLSPAVAGLSRPFCFLCAHHWPVPLSLATTRGISVDVFSSGYRDVSVPRVCFTILWIRMVIPQRGGLPHSDIHGSMPARGSPWLFAACHVLHRLLVPRHPPNALIALEIFGPLARSNPPCTGAILARGRGARGRGRLRTQHIHASERVFPDRWQRIHRCRSDFAIQEASRDAPEPDSR